MFKAYKYRVYPNKEQRRLIEMTFSHCRYVYNYFLEQRIKIYKDTGKDIGYNKMSMMLTKLKNDGEHDWLKICDSHAITHSLKDLDTAYTRFFNGVSDYPNFKSKRQTKNTYYVRGDGIRFFDGKIKITKLGKLKVKGWKNRPQGKVVSGHMIRTSDGKYYISIRVECDMDTLPKTDKAVGIDLGIKDLVITSDGTKYDNLKILYKYENKLRRLDKELSRRQCGSANWNKTRIKLARLYAKISNTRVDYLHKISHELVNENQVICSENLTINNMVKNHNIAKSIMDCSWYELTRQLEYKSEWYGREYIKINKFYPSSQTCSSCGYINSDVKNLSVREWDCPECGTHHDRDINASKNILAIGLSLL